MTEDADVDLDAPPRRYSVVDDAVAVGRRPIGKRLRVMLDGTPVRGCREYDVDQGFVIVTKVGGDGRPLVDRALGVAREERLTGTVTVEWRD